MPRHRKLGAGETSEGSTTQRAYKIPRKNWSVRWVPVEERQELGEEYYLDGSEGAWPVKQIVDERGDGSKKEYLVEWAIHPRTKEEWRPSWERDVGTSAIDEWNAKKSAATQPVKIIRKRKSRTRVVLDSSSDQEETFGDSQDVTRDANRAKRQKANAQLAEVPNTSSPIEIQDSQEIRPATTFHVEVPVPPADKPDFEPVYTSQISSADSAVGLSSPVENTGFAISLPSHGPQRSSITLTTRPSSSRQVPDQLQSPIPYSDPGPSPASRPEVTRSQSDPIRDSPEVRETVVSAVPEDSRNSSPLFFPSRPPSPALPASSAPSAVRGEVPSTHESSTTVPRVLPEAEKSQPLAPPVPVLRPAVPSRVTDSSLQPLRSSPAALSPSPRRLFLAAFLQQEQAVQPVEPCQTTPEAKQAESKFQPFVHHGKFHLKRTPPWRMASVTSGRSSTPGKRPKSPEMSLRERPRNVAPSQDRNTPVQSRSQRQRTPKAFHKDIDVINSSHAGSSMAPDSTSSASRGVNSSAMQIDEPLLSSNIAPAASTYGIAHGTSALPIQQSIETETDQPEVQISGTQPGSATHSQQSTDDDRPRVQKSAALVPSYPILGDGEHVILLHAEGKIQEIYTDTIKSKEKSLMRFIERRESIGNPSTSTTKTTQSNEMIELIERLDDTTTHLDLGLDGSGTQYSIASEEAAQYAAYASSKFAFLGHLVDALKGESCSIAVVAKDGPVQSLLEGFFATKHVQCRRCASSQASNGPTTVKPSQASLKIDLLVGGARTSSELRLQPDLIVALDTSFDAQDPQILQIRSSRKDGNLVPVVHLLVQNSSEHVERCLPRNMPSPQRRRLHVRSTYQARTKLGGPLLLYRNPSEEDQPLDLSSIQRAVRKSPERRMKALAKSLAAAILSTDFEATWKDDEVPVLDLDQSEGTSSKSSTMAQSTPRSRAGTPNARKRLLDADVAGSTSSKRQRMTPMHDVTQVSDSPRDAVSSIDALQQTVAALRAELAAEKQRRAAAEAERVYKSQRLNEISTSLAQLQHRYETRMAQCHQFKKQIKQLESEIETRTKLQERNATNRQALQEQVQQLQADLTTAREELKGAGGDMAALEDAREQARTLVARNATLEKTVENTRKDFEFTRLQYQDASSKAVEYAAQVSALEAANAELASQASDEKRRLRDLNHQNDLATHLGRIEQLQTEKRGLEALLKRMDDELKVLKKQRGTGVQTRATSVQPPGSPRSRSRGGSPVPGMLLMKSGVGEHGGVSGSGAGGVSRASLLRHER